MDKVNKVSEDLVKAITIVTAFSVSAGFLIINLYLSDYGISDYALLNAKAIYTGIVYVLVICVALIVLLYGNNHICDKMPLSAFLMNFVVKPIILSTLFYLIFVWNKDLRDSWMRLFVPNGLRLSVLYYSSLIYLVYAPLCFILNVLCSPGYKIFNYFLCFISSLIFMLLWSIFDSFKSVFAFFLTLNIICFICIVVHSCKDNIMKKILGINETIQYNIFIWGFCLLMFFAMAGCYSNNIYPFIKERFGGAILGTIEIQLTNGDSFKGSLIHKDDKRFYVFDDQNKIHVFDISNVKIFKNW